MGAAYLLKLLGLTAKFESLHWFEEVEKKFSKDMKKIKEKEDQNAAQSKEKNQSTHKDTEEVRYLRLFGIHIKSLLDRHTVAMVDEKAEDAVGRI